MKSIFLYIPLVLTVAATVLRGAEFPDNPTRLSFGPRLGYSIKAQFSNNPAPFANNPATDPGDPISGVDHEYDDGYVRVDGSGNANGSTWNWGYENASQVVGDSMEFHSTRSNLAFGPSNSEAKDDPQYGGELTYQRVIRTVGNSGLGGLEAAFSFTDLDLESRANGAGPSTLITDRFALNGVVPPGPGYNGTFTGPGALLGDIPTRTTAPATSTSQESLSGEIYGFRLGPFLEWEMGPRLSVALSAGLSLAPTRIDYDFSETTQSVLGGTFTTSGSSSTTRLLYGGYAGATLRYDIDERWGFYVGAQFQRLNDLKLSVGAREALLDQSETLYGTAGLSFRY